MEGSVVLALDKMFMTDEDGSTGSTWHQEIIRGFNKIFR